MSTSRIYLNSGEISGGRGAERVDMTTTASPTELLGRETALGYGFAATLDTLGIDQMPVLDMQESGLIMTSSPEDVVPRIRALRKSIGLIARKAAEKHHGSSYPFVGDIIDQIAQTMSDTIAETPDLINIVAKIAKPFGEATNDDGCDVILGMNHLWSPDSEPYAAYLNPTAEKTRSPKPYQTAFLNVDRAQSTLLRYLSMRDQTPASTLFDAALDQYLRDRLKDPALLADLQAGIDYSDNFPEPSEDVKQRRAELQALFDQLDGGPNPADTSE